LRAWNGSYFDASSTHANQVFAKPQNTHLVKLSRKPAMSAVLISTKGQIVLPVAVRKALGLTPGMRVNVKVNGKAR
jgi:AbrB family looped-hinge helix DNA binding protein